MSGSKTSSCLTQWSPPFLCQSVVKISPHVLPRLRPDRGACAPISPPVRCGNARRNCGKVKQANAVRSSSCTNYATEGLTPCLQNVGRLSWRRPRTRSFARGKPKRGKGEPGRQPEPDCGIEVTWVPPASAKRRLHLSPTSRRRPADEQTLIIPSGAVPMSMELPRWKRTRARRDSRASGFLHERILARTRLGYGVCGASAGSAAASPARAPLKVSFEPAGV